MHFNGLLTAASTEYLFFASCHAFLLFSKLSKTHSRQDRFCILYFVHIILIVHISYGKKLTLTFLLEIILNNLE